jgi:hypothetical protein
MKKQSRKKLQLQTTTVRLLQSRLDEAAGGWNRTDSYSQAAACSGTCMCSLDCTASVRPCVA